jgi:peptidoglycan/LPS O-acetylase OafA/YrhL
LQRYVIAAWTGTFAIILYVIFGTSMVHRPYLNETVFQSAIHQALARNIWALAHAWIIFACTHNYGGAVNWFLSFTFWQPLAKLSYCIYILHILVISFVSEQRQQVIYFSDLRMLYQLWGDFGFSLIVSVLWTLTFEMPIPILESFLMDVGCSKCKKNEKVPTKSSTESDNVNTVDKTEAVIVINKEE